jgi:chaperonin GroES
MKLKPLADRVIVKQSEAEEKTKSGIVLPDSAKEKPTQGEVIAVGPGRIVKGERVKIEVQVGDTVLYGKYTGMPYTLGDVEVIIIKASDILAKLN